MREVKLPDNTLCFEIERQRELDGRVSTFYQYIKVNGKNIDKSKFELDSFGRITGVEAI